MKIPDEYQQLCKDLAKVLQQFNFDHGWMKEKDLNKEKTIYSFSGTIRNSDSDLSDIHFLWESGRHGEAEGKISINSTIRINVKINEK